MSEMTELYNSCGSVRKIWDDHKITFTALPSKQTYDRACKVVQTGLRPSLCTSATGRQQVNKLPGRQAKYENTVWNEGSQIRVNNIVGMTTTTMIATATTLRTTAQRKISVYKNE